MKHNLSVFVTVWLMTFTFACHRSAHKEMTPVSRHLIADTVCSYPYLNHGVVILKNGHIIMVDPINAGEMEICNTQTGKTNLIRTAHPDYFSKKDGAHNFDALLHQLPFSFYQSSMDSYYFYTLENGTAKLNRQVLRLSGTHISGAVRINDNQYLTLGLFRLGLWGFYDIKKKLLSYYGHYPIEMKIPLERDKMENIVYSFQGNMAYSDQYSKVVYGSKNFAYISCYQITGEKLKLQWEKHLVPPPAVKIVDENLELDKSVTQGGFSDVAIAGDYIFASYSQKNVTDSIPCIAHSILVYDMNGNHVANYQIDHAISKILIDMEKGFLYGISHEKEFEPVMVRFQIDRMYP